MSSVRGTSTRGRGRGSTAPGPSRGNGASSTRRRALASNSQRGSTTSRGAFGQSARQNPIRPQRGSSNVQQNGVVNHIGSPIGARGSAKTRGSWQDRWQMLTKSRERERNEAIRQGVIADPEKPRSLSEAITPVGTCQDMCAEYERVQRVVQKDVWKEEMDPNHSAFATTENEPDESRMVKKFRRAAAGLEEQLPSDLRPPAILKKTCDYLFNDVIGNASSLAHVHHFVWDRTRAIRNDFSIQQITKPEELRTAIECFERIVRFHILSLHQLALPEKPYSKYDWQQEREQLDRTLLSLMQYYDDSRGRIALRNESEFRAYCVIFQLQDPIPDLEDRVQSWPREIFQDVRLQKSLGLYMAACNVMDAQGPLKPRANHSVARQDWQRFWTLVASKEVSYLMACVAEIYFNLVRRTVLNALFRTTRANTSIATSEWTIDFLRDLLALDEGEEVYTYCERFGFTFKEREDGQYYLDLTSVRGRTLPEPTAGIPKQSKSSLVEDKRFGRTLPAVINGLTVKRAQDAGLVTELEEDDIGMEDIAEDDDRQLDVVNGTNNASVDSIDDGDSLFIPESQQPETSRTQTPGLLANGLNATSGPFSMFSGMSNGTSFGKPSSFSGDSSIFTSVLKPATQNSKAEVGGDSPKFSFQDSSITNTTTTTAPVFDFTRPPTLGVTSSTKDENRIPKKVSVGDSTGNQSSTFSAAKAPTQTTTPPLFNFPTPSHLENSEETISPRTTISPFPSDSTPKAEPRAAALEQSRPQLSFGPSAGTPATTTPSFLSQPMEAKASQQPHSTSSPASPTSLPSPSGLSSGVKRSSFSGDNRPKKPSPLINSFSATDDNNNAIQSKAASEVVNQPIRDLFSSQQDFISKAPNTNSNDIARANDLRTGENFDAIVARVADDFLTDPVGGILRQYVEFHVNKVVHEVHDQISSEQLEAEARDWRQYKLHVKYGKRWRDVHWQRRLAKSGRERRQRRQRRLQERSSQEAEGSSLFDTEPLRPHSRLSSISALENVDMGRYQHFTENRQGSLTIASDQQTRPGSKRPMSSHDPASTEPPQESRHKKMKNTSHVDDRGRVAKLTTANHPNADILRRSSFLGFSLSRNAKNNQNTTKSSYFRLKALGINRIEDSIGARGTKRRSESTQASSETSPPALRPPSLLGSSPEQVAAKSLMPPPSSMPSHAQKINDEDDALFARLKAAREGLKENSTYYASEITKDNELQRSMKSSQSSNESESHSMTEARAEARLRSPQSSSQLEANTTRRHVPAYRLRESRFVPRENYAKAIERAQDIRASRSRETSRPASRLSHDTTESKIPPTAIATALPAQSQIVKHQSLHQLNREVNQPNGFVHEEPFRFDSHPDSLSESTPRASISFASHNTEIPNHNPFLQVPVPKGINNLGTQPAYSVKDKPLPVQSLQDHTIQPSQINQALANSFGHSQGHGHNHMLSVPQNSSVPPQQNSYLPSQTISLLSDDDEEEDEVVLDPPSQKWQPCAAAESTEDTEELLDETADEDEFVHTHGHPNPYAALALRDDIDDERQGWDSQVEDAGGEEEDHDGGPNGYGGDTEEDEDAANGDIDEDDTEEAGDYDDEDGYESDNGDGEEDFVQNNSHWQPQQYEHSSTPSSGQNPVFQGVGGTAEEAIELSD